MEENMTEAAPSMKKKTPVLMWVLLLISLALMAWFSRYWFSSGFGLYEDDLTFIPGAIEADFGSIMQMVSGYLFTLAEQGRPLMWSWVVLFAHLGWHLGGLQGMYIIAYFVWLINITLFVLLLRKVGNHFFFCVVGGIAYVLFSADTNQAFLFNAFGLQTAITFLLIAMHFYLSKDKLRWIAYLFLLLVLINYESPYWLFLAAPLLTAFKGKRLKNRLLENTFVMTAIFIVIFILRYLAGDSRVAGLGLIEMVLTPLRQMVIGPFVGLGIYFLRPILVLRNFTPGLGLAALIGAVVIFSGLFWIIRRQKFQTASLSPLQKKWWRNLPPEIQRELRLVLAGFVMLVFAYPFTILLRPYAISGRETRVHLAAVVGAALIMASVITIITRVLTAKGLRFGFLALMSVIFGFNFAFGFIIQKAYQRAWTLQKAFWRELLPIIDDVEEGTAVLIEPSGLEDVLYIDANTWVVPRMLPRFFVFPDDWESPPSVFRLAKFWEENLVRVPGYFTIDGTNSFAHLVAFGDYEQEKSIYITTSKGTFERQYEMFYQDETISLKPVGPGVLSTLETRILYDLMILED
jgi:hypothetical protein